MYEEGINNIKGSIWSTVWFLRILSFIIDVLLFSLNYHLYEIIIKYFFQAAAKLVCAVLSLPFPSKPSNPIIPDNIEQRTLQKILLVGYDGSGASTIFKQVIAYIWNYRCHLSYACYSVYMRMAYI